MSDVRPPTPPAPPQPPASYSASGLAPVSGVLGGSGSFSGPWFEVEQGMDITYSRWPVGQLSSVILSLSANTITFANNGSIVVAQTNAYVNARKTYTQYSTSSYQQPQKFSIVAASTDYQGNYYGVVPTGMMGPAGDVTTSQPYYLREQWDQNVHAPLLGASSCNGHTYYTMVSSCGYGNMLDSSPYINDFESAFIPDGQAGHLKSNWDARSSNYWPSYWINGPYSPQSETTQKVINYIDGMGHAVRGQDLFAPMPIINSNGIVERGVGIVTYDISRHDYS